MFERYTERARRVIFFARYEASTFGSPYIESEHLLLGLLREGRQPLKRYLDTQAAAAEVREALLPSAPAEPTSTSVDLPLSNEGKRTLAYANEESQRLAHRGIGLEALMLGILREENSSAARKLRDHGAQLERTRAMVDEAGKEGLVDGGLIGAASATPSTSVFASTGSGSAPRTRKVDAKVVDAVSSQVLLAFEDAFPFQHMPRIGETILIREEGNRHAAAGTNPESSSETTYRVKDVRWSISPETGASVPAKIELRVVRE